MRRRNELTKPRQIASARNPSRWAALRMTSYPDFVRCRENPPPLDASPSSAATADAVLEFGRFCVLLRRRQLFADGVPVELGTRAFDLLLVLLEADGLLVTKDELLSRVWPGIVVSEENLKVQISALRKALGAGRDVIRTEVGRGYRFTGVVRASAVADDARRPMRAQLRSAPTVSSPASGEATGRGPLNGWHSPRCTFSWS